MSGPLLAIRDLAVEFTVEGSQIRALNGVDLDVHTGEVVGVVGETGSGKSVTALAVLGLSGGRVTGGSIRFEDRELLSLRERELRALRGSRISMIFQEPMTSLDPSFTIGSLLVEVLRSHRPLPVDEARKHSIRMLKQVRMPHAERVMRQYPFELSGGMRQRVMIALALACGPRLLIADEPTTALDVTVQAQILALLKEIRAETGAAMLLITHDLAIVSRTCDRVYVMYAGRVVESAPVEQLFARPGHPYTQGLIAAIPSGRQARLRTIPGEPPDPGIVHTGCPFAPRCPAVMPRCAIESPPMYAAGTSHQVACHLHDRAAPAEPHPGNRFDHRLPETALTRDPDAATVNVNSTATG
jgi:oligopeptide/dipeptide ABC transporter ATP-binding protein